MRSTKTAAKRTRRGRLPRRNEMKPGNPVPHHDSRRSDFISQKSGVTVDKSAPRWYVISQLDCRGVVAKRLGSGLQNRSDRFDSGPRLHFFCFDFCFAIRRGYLRRAASLLGHIPQYAPSCRLARRGVPHPNGFAKGVGMFFSRLPFAQLVTP